MVEKGRAGSRRVRMRDVATRAGVSAATVSRALNNRPTVDPQLADRVRKVAAELGYEPNRVARSLRRQAGSVWALIISDIENPFFTSVARGVEEVALHEGYSVVLCNTDENIARERRYLDVVLAEQAAGVIIAPASDRTDISMLRDHDVPVVTIDRRIRDEDVDTVVVDNYTGARLATRHLLDAGYRRVACISGPSKLTTAAERRKGYAAAVRAAGQEVDRRLVRETDFRVEGGYVAAGELLDLAEAPDAFFVANNLMAAGAMRALRERGVDVPDAVGVVGFDDSPWAPLMAPALTIVEQPTYLLGTEAARLLQRRLADRTAPVEAVTLPTELRVRDSSRGPQP
ncbi:LacI family DNA-binding transcriptional regulator [Actinopolymorpha sp. B17G11]|uniref:LacI family DNA-binding transcriptional regulator n=1 Tax=Actinopolymorpha sp. B17G11 TaxID=3160861 RepID=UPI0032E4CDAF